MDKDRTAKAMVAGSLGLFVIAIVILFLFVLPALQGTGTPSVAQMGGPGMGGPGGPGGMPGGPGGMPGMGGPGGMGAPGGMGGMAPGGMEAAAAPPAAVEGGRIAAKSPVPLEPPRVNPFLPLGAEAGGLEEITATKYGPDYSKIPITTRLGFTRVSYPRMRHLPPLPDTRAEARMRISSIMWSEGSPIATYETKDGESGTVRPGDLVESWEVLEIGRDHVIMRNRDTDEVQRVPLKGGAGIE